MNSFIHVQDIYYVKSLLFNNVSCLWSYVLKVHHLYFLFGLFLFLGHMLCGNPTREYTHTYHNIDFFPPSLHSPSLEAC